MLEEDSTWKQMERNMKQVGFREGAIKGKEDNFQKGFDVGYEVGFATGQLLGEAMGMAMFRELIGDKEILKKTLALTESPKKPDCTLCINFPSGSTSNTDSDIAFEDVEDERRKYNEDLKKKINIIHDKSETSDDDVR